MFVPYRIESAVSEKPHEDHAEHEHENDHHHHEHDHDHEHHHHHDHDHGHGMPRSWNVSVAWPD